MRLASRENGGKNGDEKHFSAASKKAKENECSSISRSSPLVVPELVKPRHARFRCERLAPSVPPSAGARGRETAEGARGPAMASGGDGRTPMKVAAAAVAAAAATGGGPSNPDALLRLLLLHLRLRGRQLPIRRFHLPLHLPPTPSTTPDASSPPVTRGSSPLSPRSCSRPPSAPRASSRAEGGSTSAGPPRPATRPTCG